MGILGFILMVVIALIALYSGVGLDPFVDIGSVLITAVVTLAALLMSYGSGLGTAIKTVFSSGASRDDVKLGIAVFTKGKSYALASGALGTLIGLVIMLKNLDDPSAIGPGLALSLLTIVYGLVIAYLILGPVVGSLQRRLDEAGE